MEVTSLDKIKKMAHGEVVQLSAFVEGQDFVVKLKRPSLYALAAKGIIPNPLLGLAKDLFEGNSRGNKGPDGDGFKDTAELLTIIAENAMAEPTYKQLEEAGVSLTDMHLIEIFNYTQTGVKKLANFREVETANTGAEPKSKV